jgi:glycosyltransferase involved in cell wall biosynthesis
MAITSSNEKFSAYAVKELPVKSSTAEKVRDNQNYAFDVTIVMPCLNEVITLPECIRGAQKTLAALNDTYGLSGELIIGDNGSTDGSIELAQQMGARVVHIKEKGYGHALDGAIRAAKGRFLVMADSDGSYDFMEAIPMIEKLTQGFDLCMGSRFKGEIKDGAMPWKNRYIGNPLLTGILNLLFDSNLSDAHCGIRAFTKAAYLELGLTSRGMEFASEMVIKATLLDVKRTEVPVTLYPDGRDRPPHLRPWRDGWRHLRYIVMLSPYWLFFVPGMIMGALGIVIFLLLLLNPNQEVIRIGALSFGNHWLIVAGMLLVLAHQNLIIGFATTLYGVKMRYRRFGKFLGRLIGAVNLEIMLSIGLITALLGAGLFAFVFLNWSAQGFGSLDQIRAISGAATLIILGMQNFFGGFLLAIIAGNSASLYEARIASDMRE